MPEQPGSQGEHASARHADATGHVPAQTLREWATRLANPTGVAPGARLPSHSRDCLGCGSDNPASLRLQVRSEGSAVTTTHRFSSRHVGAPGIVHGGAVSLAFDDLFGFCLYAQGVLAVTRRLTVDFVAPVLLHQPYTFRAAVDEVAGRRLHMNAEATSESGTTVATARAVFVRVDIDHFTGASARP